MATIFFFLHLDSPKISIREGLAKVDWAGSLVSIAAVTLFLVGIEMGGIQYSWKSALVLVCIILGLALWCLFIFIEIKFAKFPIMPMRLFAHKTNIASDILTSLHGQAFLGACFYMPLYFQACRGVEPLMSGVLTLPLALSLSLTSAVTGGVIAKTGRYQEMIWIGCFFMAVGTGALVSLTRTSGWPKYIFVSHAAPIPI
jgi:Fungal trichothecene efflux pump (TRI12)